MRRLPSLNNKQIRQYRKQYFLFLRLKLIDDPIKT